MINKKEIYHFINSIGFNLIEHNTSKYFGDYFDTFGNNILELRFSKSKSFETVDIRNLKDKEWYDLALVKAVLHDEEKLVKVNTIEEHTEFLKKEIEAINYLFTEQNYSSTKKKLEDLGNQRVNQMFKGKI